MNCKKNKFLGDVWSKPDPSQEIVLDPEISKFNDDFNQLFFKTDFPEGL